MRLQEQIQKDMSLKEVGIRAQNMIIDLNGRVNIIGRTYTTIWWAWDSSLFIMNEIFKWAQKWWENGLRLWLGFANHLVFVACFIFWEKVAKHNHLRITSHTRPSARDHYTSSTLIGGKGRAGPSSLHTTLKGPTEYVNARWMWSQHAPMDHVSWSLGLFSKTTSWK